MALLSIKDLSIKFGGDPLLDAVNLNIEYGDRACLVGRNGTGKSTFLKILAGIEEPDSGEIIKAPGIRTAYLPQDVPVGLSGTVREIVNSTQITGGDQHIRAAEEAITQLGLDAEAPFNSLSGGMKRRALMAQALAVKPDLLLLDEPTNHLDIESIEWLEKFLRRRVRTFLFVTHDRTFARNLASKIIDLDRGQLAGWNCDYPTFLRRKQQLLDDEVAEWQKKGKKLTKEEIWIRKGIKARRTRDEGRVRALIKLREEFRNRRQTETGSRIRLQNGEKSGNLVIRAEDVSFAYPDGPPIIKNFNARILRGERVGIIGRNGAGKTTLLKLLCGTLTPSSGSLILGTKLQIAYFDQLRETLDENKTIAENVADGNEFVNVGGNRRHVFSYLQDFLFTPERAKSPVFVLSGGERNRLLIARLFLQPCNFLVMDEPTNDLDTETLELLEEQLLQSSATLLLVSHDRSFLNNVVTSTLVLDGDGEVRQYPGGYDDWLAQRTPKKSEEAALNRKKPAAERPRDRKLTYREKRELEELPGLIEALEKEQSDILESQNAPAFYRQPPQNISSVNDRLKTIADELEKLVERWAELEDLR